MWDIDQYCAHPQTQPPVAPDEGEGVEPTQMRSDEATGSVWGPWDKGRGESPLPRVCIQLQGEPAISVLPTGGPGMPVPSREKDRD